MNINWVKAELTVAVIKGSPDSKWAWSLVKVIDAVIYRNSAEQPILLRRVPVYHPVYHLD